ncbi:MAG: BREX-3 system phosphatase PglZ [Chloroflexi bacterium]|nr:BREX-3 system phosphatase PglZ [Chloroflexota bacterium]
MQSRPTFSRQNPSMIDKILSYFPPGIYPLILVSDPDGLLSGEEVLVALAQRGFTLVHEPDAILLRRRIEQLKPFSVYHPLMVVTAGEVNTLPYDLWQPGRHLVLALHTFFPKLKYPVVRSLAPEQLTRLSRVAAPEQDLSQQASIRFILRHVFEADLGMLRQPANLISWLNAYHARQDGMPQMVQQALLESLQSELAYRDWSLPELLASRDQFSAFIKEQWSTYLGQSTGRPVREERTPYLLNFGADPGLQDALPGLLRSGMLIPLSIDQPQHLPLWSRPGVLATEEERTPRRIIALQQHLTTLLAGPADAALWQAWQAIAYTWAELNNLWNSVGQISNLSKFLSVEQHQAQIHLQESIDSRFAAWLRQHYAPLGGRSLPKPHHVHHIPRYLAYERRGGRAGRVALLILDGMALADWQTIYAAWRPRHGDWNFHNELVLAQIPTITAVSRQALVSGLRPAEFAATLDNNRLESQEWAAFWGREGIPVDATAYMRFSPPQDMLPLALDSKRIQALCLVETSIDEIVHGASLGEAAVQASLRLWLQAISPRLEETIDMLISTGFTVYLASDHGHVEARGIGQPSEGVTVDTRGKRARLYRDESAAAVVEQSFPQTIRWGQDGLLPDNVWVLMAQGRTAFAAPQDMVVTHGGPTLDEVVVPFIRVSAAS